MQYNRNYDFSAGQTIVADQVDMELNSIRGVINGNIDNDNLAANCVTSDKIAAPANPETRFAETNQPMVYTGIELSPSSGWTANQLTATITPGTIYLGGKRILTSSVTNHPFTASKDTYVDIDGNGTISYQEQTLGGAEPALASGSMRIMKVVTDALHITTYTDLRRMPDGIWRNWAPVVTLNGGTTNGNSVITGRYARVGKTVHFTMKYVIGTTANYGGLTSFDISLPVAANSYYTDGFPMGKANFLDSGSAWYSGDTIMVSGKLRLHVLRVDGTYAYQQSATGTAPFTWAAANGDAFSITGTYEEA